MKNNVVVIQSINAPAEWVWDLISNVGGVQHWMPGILDCRLEGRGIGAYRFCKTESGWLREVIENIDHTKLLFQYYLTEQDIMPFENFGGSIQVKKTIQTETESKIHWTGEFETRNDSADSIKKMVEELFIQGIKGIEKLYQDRRPYSNNKSTNDNYQFSSKLIF